MKYSFLKGLGKGVAAAIIFSVPLVLLNSPAWADITIGTLLLMAVNFLKIKTKSTK